LTEISQEFMINNQSFTTQNFRIYKPSAASVEDGFFDLFFRLGVLPSHVEIVSSFETSIQSDVNLFTDTNGFDFQARKYNSSLPIQGNHFPSPWGAYIKDGTSQLSLIYERSHGTSSLRNGHIETMIHRNPDMSDGFGPGLTDTDVVFPAIRVLAGAPSAVSYHTNSHNFNYPPVIFTSSPTSSISNYVSNFETSGQFLAADFPRNLHLLSFRLLSGNNFIIRLVHIFAIDEDSSFTGPVTVDIAKIFPMVKVVSVSETTISANRVLVNNGPSTVTLTTKEIRTFIVQFA